MQVRRNTLADQIRWQHPVDHVAGDRHVELGEQLRCLRRVEDDHLFGHDHKKECRLLPVGENAGGLVDAVLDVLQLAQNVIFFRALLPLDARHHLLMLAHFLTQLGDAINPLVVDLGHGEVIKRVSQRDQVIDVVVVVAADNDVYDRVENGRLFHGRFRRCSLDIVLDFFRHLLQPVHVCDLLANLVLISVNVTVGVDLLGKEVIHDLDRTFAINIFLKDVAKGSLGIDREHQHFVSLLCQPEGGGGRKSGLTQPAFPAEHDVTPVLILFERLFK